MHQICHVTKIYKNVIRSQLEVNRSHVTRTSQLWITDPSTFVTCRHILGQTVRLSDWVTLSDFCGMWRLGSDTMQVALGKHHHFAVASEGSRIWWCAVRGSYRNFVETLCRKLVDSCAEMLCVIRFVHPYFSVVSCLLESVMRLCYKSKFKRMRREMRKCRLQASLMF